MLVTTTSSRNRRTTVLAEEDRLWVSFYQRVGREPALAAEVLGQLDVDQDMKHAHLGLYLSCRESLRLHQAREERHLRIGAFVRWLLGGLLVRGPQRFYHRTASLVVACLPESMEPAADKVRRLAKDPKVRAARRSFKAADVVAPVGAPAVAIAKTDATTPVSDAARAA